MVPDGVDLGLGLQQVGGHGLAGLHGELRSLTGGDLEAEGGQRVSEALAAVLGEGEVVDTGDLGDDRVGHALVGQALADVVAGADAHAVVVTGDVGPVGLRGGEDAVEVDDRDAGLHGLLGDLGQGLALEGQDDQGVDAGVDQRLDLGDLLVDVVGALGDLQGHVVVLVGSGLCVLGDGRDPAVVGCGGGEADGDRLAGLLGRAGRVAELLVAVGQQVDPRQALLKLEDAA